LKNLAKNETVLVDLIRTENTIYIDTKA